MGFLNIQIGGLIMKKNEKMPRGNVIKLSIDSGKCINCNKCLLVCPITRAAGLDNLENEIVRRLCFQCNNCAASCPEGAITVGNIALTGRASSIPDSEAALNLIMARRSVRSYKEMPVKQEDIYKLVEAVKYSPTGHNKQYIDVIVIWSPEILKKLTEIGMKMSKKMSKQINSFPFSLIMKKVLGKETYFHVL